MHAAPPLAARTTLTTRTWAAIELAVVVGLTEAELWALRGHGLVWSHAGVYALLVATVAVSIARRHAEAPEPAPTVGRARAWGEAAAITLALSTVLLLAAMLVGDSNETYEFLFLRKPPLKLAGWLAGKVGAALAQQVALQWFLWPVCREVTGGRALGAGMAAAIFGLVHLPSPTLVGITAIGGLAWVLLYRRGGRLAPLVASHMALATLAHGGLPERMTYDMRVGSAATADSARFATLADPKARQINRRLKDHRDDLRRYASADYYQAQGGTDAGFIRGLFRDILGRPAAESDVAFWLDRHFPDLRDRVPSIFLASDEYAQILAARPAASTRR